jgi:hypothetical protein
MTFRIYRRWTIRGRRWFWRAKSGNYRITMSGQSAGFHNLGDVGSIIETIKREAADAKVVIEPDHTVGIKPEIL